MSIPKPLIEIKGATKKYLDIVFDIEVIENDFLLVTGKNGCGKSTLIKMILKFVKPDFGKILNKIKSISYLPEVIDLPPSLSVIDYIRLTSKLKNVSINQKWLYKLNLPLEKNIGQLSKGNRQKLALYFTLVGNEKLVILDEPLSGLDKDARKVLMEMIKEKLGTTTFVVSTHNKRTFEKFMTKEIDMS